VDEEHVYLILPYLTCRKRFRVRGLEFRNSEDLADLSVANKEHLSALCEMFFLQENVRIKQFVCAALPLPQEQDERRKQARLAYEAHLLIAFLYASPHPSGGVFLPFESCSLFTFTLGDSPPGSGNVPSSLVWQGEHLGDRVSVLGRSDDNKHPDWIPGYTGTRNQNETFWVAKGSRIFPESAHVTLNFSQELSFDIERFLAQPQNWALRAIYLHGRGLNDMPEVQNRMFVGLEWYLRSCKDSISPAEKIVNVAIALESLLRVRPGESLTERFKDAVTALVGPVPRLDSWLEQFYSARSKAVHEGVPHQLTFFAVNRDALKNQKKNEDDLLPHRSLIEYARRIFRICLTAVVSSATQTMMTGLPGLFVHNRERLEAICKTLRDTSVAAEKRILAIQLQVGELQEFSTDIMEPYIEIGQVLGAAKLLLEAYKATAPALPPETLQALDNIIRDQCQESEKFKQLECCSALLRPELVSSVGSSSQFLSTVMTFLTYATTAGFALRAYMTQHPRK
jgi:hypothetical protein